MGLERPQARGRRGWARCRFALEAGEAAAFSLRYAGEPVRPIDPHVAERLLDVTASSWRAWSERCHYQGIGAELVRRSALALKGLVFHPSGALIAVPTTSLPEEIGGERNWEYRFTWLRVADAAGAVPARL